MEIGDVRKLRWIRAESGKSGGEVVVLLIYAKANLDSISGETLKELRDVAEKALSDAELAAFEDGQNVEALLVQSAREMGAGKTRKVYTPVVAARENAGLSQAGFADLLGVSVRTLQQWEQGRREPSGAAKTLIRSP